MKDERLLLELNEAEDAITKVERLVESDASFEQLIDALAETRSFVERAGWLMLSNELHNCLGGNDGIHDGRVIDVIRKLLGAAPSGEGK